MAANTTVWLCFSPTCLLFEVEKELLVENESHAADLFYFGLCSGVPVDEVGCDGDRQLPPELFSFETWEQDSEIKNETKKQREAKNQNQKVNLPGTYFRIRGSLPMWALIKPSEQKPWIVKSTRN